MEWSHQDDTRQSTHLGESDARSVHSHYGYSNTVVKRPPATSRKSTTSVYGASGDTESINAALSRDPNLSDVGGSGLEDGGVGGGDEGDEAEGEDVEEEADTSSADAGYRQPPHEAAFALHSNSTMAQLEVVQDLVNSVLLTNTNTTATTAAAAATVPLSSAQSTSSRSIKSTPSSTSSSEDPKQILQTSLTTLHTLFAQYTSMAKDRENWFKRQLASERARQSVWEESLATVVKEGAKLEEELRVRSRRRGSRVFGFSEAFREGDGSVRRRSGRFGGVGPGGTLKAPLPPVVVEEEGVQTQIAEGASREVAAENTMLGGPAGMSPPPQSFVPVKDEAVREERAALKREDTVRAQQKPLPPVVVATEEEGEGGYESADSDEFFDAVDSNNIPNLVIPASLASPNESISRLPPYVFVEPFKGYAVLRTKLETADERPPTSLWSVLKRSIGKELTKISFPVFFNEPTSMLQRMAEDMEFSECCERQLICF